MKNWPISTSISIIFKTALKVFLTYTVINNFHVYVLTSHYTSLFEDYDHDLLSAVNKLIQNPFSSEYADRTQLRPEPLARVLVQIRYLPIKSFSRPESELIAIFQEKVRKNFPFMMTISHNEEIGNLNADGNIEGEPRITSGSIHHFVSTDQKSRLTISGDALTLETAEYISRDSFLLSFRTVLEHFFNDHNPVVNGMGFRYVNSLPALGEDGIPKVSEMVRSELLGLRNHFDNVDIIKETNNARVKVEEGWVTLNWGYNPSGEVHDISIVSPVAVPTWFLDIDSVTEENKDVRLHDIDSIMDRINGLANRGRTIFSWSVTETFLDVFKTED